MTRAGTTSVPGRLTRLGVVMSASTLGGTGQLDAILLSPLIAVLITTGDGRSAALLNSEADTQGARTLSLPGTGPTVATSYDNQGRKSRVTISTDSTITVPVPAADPPSCCARSRPAGWPEYGRG